MARTIAYVNAFTAGEIGSNAWERTDLQQHAKGCAAGLNLIGLVTGPMASRGGFIDVGAAVFQPTPSRILGFTRSTGDALFLEFGQGVMRVRTPMGAPVLSSGVPYEIATPWTAAEVARLWFKQINDVIYVTSLDGGPTISLLHRADDDWTWSSFDFREGPWLAENPTGPVLSLTGVGVVTATASTASFTASDVGSRIRFREGDGNPGYDTWTSATDYAVGVLVQFDGRVFKRVAGGTGGKSGTTPPLHQSGTLSDGKLLWAFQHDGAGVLRITAFVDALTVTCATDRPGPPVTETAYWAKQAYGATQGYPRALVAERDERLIFASSIMQPGIVDMTRSFGFGRDYGDFKPGLGTGRVVEDDAVRLGVGGTERVVWMLSSSVLLAGCTDGEYILSGATLDDPITPGGRSARPVSEYGNADVPPLKVQGPPPAILHVLGSRKALRETRVSPDLSVESHDRSLLAHHIFDRGVAGMAWQQPENLVWMRLDDGGLAAMVYHMEHEVYGVTRQPLPGDGTPAGWKIESLDTVRATGGDLMLASVMRLKAGVPQRRIWRMTRRTEDVWCDGASVYSGAATDTVAGLDRYEGETLVVVADGGRVTDTVVSGGTITLPFEAERIVTGEAMVRRFETLPLDMEGVGSTNGRVLTPTHATVILSCVDALVGTDAADSAHRVQSRAAGDLAAPVGKRVRQRVGLGGGASRDRRLVIETTAPFDLMIHAYRLEAEATA